MPAKREKKGLLIVQVAGLGLQTFNRSRDLKKALADLVPHPLAPSLPAVTCTSQASFRTASEPAQHGMVANGWLHRDLCKTTFWEQSAQLVSGQRIWTPFRERGKRIAMLFWQQSMGETADIIVSPAPLHKHNGSMIDACYSTPPGIVDVASRIMNEKFRLRHYWGPTSSARGSRWIARFTALLLSGRLSDAPDLCLTYLPALDYDFQRYGPGGKGPRKALRALAADLALLRQTCDREGYHLLIWGDYAISAANSGPAIYPNQLLFEAGLLQTRIIKGRHYVDLHTSRAFALCDHQIAHIYLKNPADSERVAKLLSNCGQVNHRTTLPALNHPRSGELILTAPPGGWFAYPWWRQRRQAPDYATHVDIHSKPGFDPCELFFGWPPGSITMNTNRIGGVHGNIGPDLNACWLSDAAIKGQPHTTASLGQAVADYLETL